MIRKHTRRAAKAAFAISLGVAIVIGLFAAVLARPAHAKSTAGPTVIIGTKNFPEEFILGQLYKQALEAKGFKVSYKENIGSTELIQTSLTSGKINMYPEYTGVIVQDVFHHALSAKTASGTYQLAKQLEAKKGYTLLKPTPFFDTDVVAVTNATAKKFGLEVDRRPEEGRQLQARRVPGMQDEEHLLPRLHEAVRDHERVIPPARRNLGVRGAGCRQGAGGRRVLDRPAARQGLEVHGARRPEARDRLPERRPDRQGDGGVCTRLEVHEHGQRRLGDADTERDRGDEQGRDRQQAKRGEASRRRF